MSIKALNWAWEQNLAPTTKLILLAFADHADDSGVCWPGRKGVAAKCGVSTRTVERQVKTLEQHGLIWREPRFRSDGSQRTSLYHLTLGGVSESPDLRAGVAPASASASPLEPSVEPSEESSREPLRDREVAHTSPSRARERGGLKRLSASALVNQEEEQNGNT